MMNKYLYICWYCSCYSTNVEYPYGDPKGNATQFVTPTKRHIIADTRRSIQQQLTYAHA
jgi:hypothetical protein